MTLNIHTVPYLPDDSTIFTFPLIYYQGLPCGRNRLRRLRRVLPLLHLVGISYTLNNSHAVGPWENLDNNSHAL